MYEDSAELTDEQISRFLEIMNAGEEVEGGSVRKGPKARIRYNAKWWEGIELEAFDWNGTEGPGGNPRR